MTFLEGLTECVRIQALAWSVPDWVQHEFLGVSVWQYLVAFVLVLLGLVVKKVSDHMLGDKLLGRLRKTRFQFDHLVVEAVSKDPHYLYGKRVFYIDPESYLILWEEVYDENGRFWKMFCNYTDVLPTKINDQKHFIVGTCFPDFVRTHSGLSHQQHFWEPEISSPEQTADMFTINYLQKTY